MVPRGFISSLLCLSFLFAAFLCGALFCVSFLFNDVNKVDAAWVEQHFSLPCAQPGGTRCMIRAMFVRLRPTFPHTASH